MFELDEIIRSTPATYLVVLGLVTLDAVFPVAPSETLLAAAGVLVAADALSAPAVIAAGACGALIGHTILFALGRWSGPRVRARILRSDDARDAYARATALLHERTWLLMLADFVPWGRTVLMYAAGAVAVPVRRFYTFVVPGALIWASFYVGLGVVGGETFEQTWPALAASIAAVLLIGGIAELVHRARSGRADGD